MCVTVCNKCHKRIIALPCAYHITPKEYAKEYPKEFAKAKQAEDTAIKKHRCIEPMSNNK